MTEQSVLQRTAEAYDLVFKAHQQMEKVWLSDVLFTWRWWLGLFFFIAPWVFWYFVRRRQSSGRMLFVMFFVIILASLLDFVGCGFFGLWHYSYEILPLMPAYVPWDFSLIPILVALVIQLRPQASPILKAIIVGGIFAYVGEPLFTALKMYQPDKWRFEYSFAIMIVIYLMAHGLSRIRSFDELS